MSSKFRSEHLAGQTLTSAEVQAEGPNCLAGSREQRASGLNGSHGWDHPCYLGEYPKGWEKA